MNVMIGMGIRILYQVPNHTLEQQFRNWLCEIQYIVLDSVVSSVTLLPVYTSIPGKGKWEDNPGRQAAPGRRSQWGEGKHKALCEEGSGQGFLPREANYLMVSRFLETDIFPFIGGL